MRLPRYPLQQILQRDAGRPSTDVFRNSFPAGSRRISQGRFPNSTPERLTDASGRLAGKPPEVLSLTRSATLWYEGLSAAISAQMHCLLWQPCSAHFAAGVDRAFPALCAADGHVSPMQQAPLHGMWNTCRRHMQVHPVPSLLRPAPSWSMPRPSTHWSVKKRQAWPREQTAAVHLDEVQRHSSVGRCGA